MTTNPTPAPLSPSAVEKALAAFGERVSTFECGAERAMYRLACELRDELAMVRAERDELKKRVADARKAAINDVGGWLARIGETGAAYIVRTCDIPEGGA